MIPNDYLFEHKKRKNYRIVSASREDFLPQKNMIMNGFLFVSNRSNASQLVTLDLDSKPITVLCQMGDFGCGDGGWTPLMKIDGSKVSPIRRNILGGVFLRVMKREQEIFRSVETTIESLSNSPIFLSRSLLAEIPLAWVLQYPNI